MRRFLALVVVFALGLGLMYGLVRGYDRLSGRTERRAASNLAALLSKPPVPANIPDTAMVTAAARIEPSVVNLDTLGEGAARGVDMFGNRVVRLFRLHGKASGVIISADGYVLTNSHVVSEANTIRATLQNGQHYDGRVIAADPEADLAIVKIDGRGLVPAEFGDSDRLKVGEYVLAIGNPLGIGSTVTHGIISATNRRNLQISEGLVLKEAIQTDAPINQGNSGGALANLQGQLIGINTAIASSSPRGGSIGIGFAIPTNAARRVLKELLASGRKSDDAATQPFIGIVYQPVPSELARELDLQPGEGVLVSQVSELAGQAGVQPGSVIVSIDGKPLRALDDVRAALRGRRVGQTIPMQLVLSDGARKTVNVTLGRRIRLGGEVPSP